MARLHREGQGNWACGGRRAGWPCRCVTGMLGGRRHDRRVLRALLPTGGVPGNKVRSRLLSLARGTLLKGACSPTGTCTPAHPCAHSSSRMSLSLHNLCRWGECPALPLPRGDSTEPWTESKRLSLAASQSLGLGPPLFRPLPARTGSLTPNLGSRVSSVPRAGARQKVGGVGAAWAPPLSLTSHLIHAALHEDDQSEDNRVQAEEDVIIVHGVHAVGVFVEKLLLEGWGEAGQ